MHKKYTHDLPGAWNQELKYHHILWLFSPRQSDKFICIILSLCTSAFSSFSSNGYFNSCFISVHSLCDTKRVNSCLRIKFPNPCGENLIDSDWVKYLQTWMARSCVHVSGDFGGPNLYVCMCVESKEMKSSQKKWRNKGLDTQPKMHLSFKAQKFNLQRSGDSISNDSFSVQV